MEVYIKIKENFLEVLKYLEELGYVWGCGETPTSRYSLYVWNKCVPSTMCVNKDSKRIYHSCSVLNEHTLEEVKIGGLLQ